MVESWLAVEADGPDAVLDLRDWLVGEPALRGRVRVATAAPRPGELGSWSDTLVVAVGAGGALTTLAASLKIYLAQPRSSTVRLKTVKPDGTRTEVTAEHIARSDVESVLKAALHSEPRYTGPGLPAPADPDARDTGIRDTAARNTARRTDDASA
ncbi:effector-associated constant component EACC1 [Kitasatospora sp. NPDC054795]